MRNKSIHKKIQMVTYYIYSALFVLVAFLVFVIDFKVYKAGGGGGSIVLVIGSIVSAIFEGFFGKFVFALLSLFCGVIYLRKAIKLVKH